MTGMWYPPAFLLIVAGFVYSTWSIQ
ncbi:hypothetical protein XELAEV_180372612mg, partial [Xenopus laevis]